MPARNRIERLVSVSAGTITAALVALPPIVLFLTEHQRLSGGLEAEAELNARIMTQMISRNPDLWEFEQVRLGDQLSASSSSGQAELRRVVDSRGAVVAHNGIELAPPLVTRSIPLLDAGIPVARVELSRSLRPLLWHAGLLLLGLAPVGLLVHRLLCTLPLGALRRSQEALRNERDRARRYLEVAGVAIVVLDREGIVAQVNPKAAEVLGRSGEDVRGRPWESFFEPGPREEMASALAKGLSGMCEPCEIPLLRPDGARRTVSWNVAPLAGGNDEERGLLLSGVDVTAQRELETQALHDEKLRALGKLAGGIAHDFNNVLSVIKGCSIALLEDLPEDHRGREDLLEILAASDRAASLTRGLLAFSRRRTVEARSANLVELLHHSERLLRRLLREDISLEMVLPSSPLVVWVDPAQLDSVLMNVVANARDAMPEGGRIVLRARSEPFDARRARLWGVEPGEHALVTIADTGVGMGREQLSHLFEPFFTTKDVGKGTGLGLSLSHGIMRQHQGGIRVSSEPGVGTTVSLVLPLHEEVERGEAPTPGEATGGSETLLVAEDDPSVRRVIRRTLERSGYTVLEAIDGEDAVLKFRDHRDRVGLTLLDVVMPRMNGRQALDRIRAIHPDARVLFLSGHAEDPAGRQAIDLSPERLLPKPAQPDELLRAVRNLLDA